MYILWILIPCAIVGSYALYRLFKAQRTYG